METTPFGFATHYCKPETALGAVSRPRSNLHSSPTVHRIESSLSPPIERNVQPLFFRACPGVVVAGRDVTEHPHGRVVGEHAPESCGRFGRAVGDDDLAGVLGIADADAAAVVEAHPGRARGDVDHRV